MPPDPAGVPVEVRHLYVHAPFCARRCRYCDFAVAVDRDPEPGGWLRALEGELRALEAEGRVRLASSLDTLYVGGGTPSLLGPRAMDGLRDIVGPSRLEGGSLEWTAEANPESLTRDVAESWRRAGVSRVSLGVQSFQDPVLRWMGRLHGPEGAEAAVARAREAGLAELSLDLIFGLPPSVGRDWEDDLDRALALEPPHVSLYGLTAEPTTPLGRDVGAGRTVMPDEERYRDEYLTAHERLGREGYVAYEVSNFARPGHESRHNRAYWDLRPYLGLGNGAHSYLPPQRRWNLRDWHAYASEASEGHLPLEEREEVAESSSRLEALWLGLRTDRGIARTRLTTPGSRDLAAAWVRAGWARDSDRRLVLTPEGWLLLDRLAVDLDAALDAAVPARRRH